MIEHLVRHATENNPAPDFAKQELSAGHDSTIYTVDNLEDTAVYPTKISKQGYNKKNV